MMLMHLIAVGPHTLNQACCLCWLDLLAHTDSQATRVDVTAEGHKGTLDWQDTVQRLRDDTLSTRANY